MRLQLRTDAAGTARISVLADINSPRFQVLNAKRSLVYSNELQDRIYPDKKLAPAGFGALAAVKKFTTLAKSRLKEFGAIVDNGLLEHVVFLTGTLPGGTIEARKALAEWSGWVVSRLCQWLRDCIPGVQYFGVWEYQKRGALHLHLCARVRDTLQANALKQAWKGRWISLIDAVGRMSGQDMYMRMDGRSWQCARWIVRTDAQTVVQSVARYLSKYCSKTASKRRNQAAFPPSSWWFASKNLRESAKMQRLVITVPNMSLNGAISLFESMSGLAVGASAVSYPIFNKWDSRYMGVICLMPPCVAGIFNRIMQEVLRPLGAIKQLVDKDAPLTMSEIVEMFTARKLLTV